MADTYIPRLKTEYEKVIRPKLTETFGYSNTFAVPAVTKVVINMGLGNQGVTAGGTALLGGMLDSHLAQGGLAVVRVLDEEGAIETDRLAMLALVAGAVGIVPDLVFAVAAAAIQGRRQRTSPEQVRSSCRIGGAEA